MNATSTPGCPKPSFAKAAAKGGGTVSTTCMYSASENICPWTLRYFLTQRHQPRQGCSNELHDQRKGTRAYQKRRRTLRHRSLPEPLVHTEAAGIAAPHKEGHRVQVRRESVVRACASCLCVVSRARRAVRRARAHVAHVPRLHASRRAVLCVLRYACMAFMHSCIHSSIHLPIRSFIFLNYQ